SLLCVSFLPVRLRTPTLFPYTTLFRSRDNKQRGSGALGYSDPGAGPRFLSVGWETRVVASTGAGLFSLVRENRRRLVRGGGVPLDRKSTRLNSSHVSISYAVFGVKKKK